MSDDAGKPRKRDILLSLFKHRRPSRANKTSLKPSGADGPPAGNRVAHSAAKSSSNETTTRAQSAPLQQPTTPLAIESPPQSQPKDGTPRPDPESQSGPTAATATAKDTTQIGNEGEQPTSTATSNIEAKPSLWDRAINNSELPLLRQTLTELGIGSDTVAIATAVETITERIVKDNQGKEWKIPFGGEQIVLRDMGKKLLEWVHRFKEIGDIIVSFDPGHAALPWAGFRFLLQLCYNKEQKVDALLIGLEKTAGIIDRCTAYELLYLNGDSASERLEKSILALYTAILKYLDEAITRSKGEHSRRRKLPRLTRPQITASRQYLPAEKFPSTSIMLGAWRKLFKMMLLSPEPNLHGRILREFNCFWTKST
jgi:hypothetical protein